MRINEAAEKAGVTPKNIRFYEAEKLLTPQRNLENRYRDYSEADVQILRRIRLLRMLDFPIAEIREMLAGRQSLQSGLARHQVLLESRQQTLAAAEEICAALSAGGQTLAELEPDGFLEKAKEQQRKGACFVDVKRQDNKRKRYLGAILGAAIFTVLMMVVISTEIWAFMVDPAGAPPLPLAAFLVGLPIVIVIAVLVSLALRFKEIKGGEEDAYRNY